MFIPGSLTYNDDGQVVLTEGTDIVVSEVMPITKQRASGDYFYDPDVENARLFAAAPDMLAALEALTEWANSYRPPLGPDTQAMITQARAAIAKARG